MLTSDFDNLRMGLPSGSDLLEDRFIDRWGKPYDQILKEYAASIPLYVSKKPENSFSRSGRGEIKKNCSTCSRFFYGEPCDYNSCKGKLWEAVSWIEQ